MSSQQEVLPLPQIDVHPREWIGPHFGAIGRFVRQRPLGAIAGTIAIILLVAGIAAPVISPYDPIEADVTNALRAPSWDHPFGTDYLGRDQMSRIFWGARYSMLIGYGATAVSLLVCVTIGMISGYFGGIYDIAIQRFVDAVEALPGLLILLTVVTILEPTVVNLLVLLGIQSGIGRSRVIRSAVLSVRAQAFVEATRTLGATHMRVILRHILPNIMAIVLVIGSLSVGGVIIAEASLGFLGFGVQPPDPTWGQMLSSQSRRFMVAAPWMALAPGIAISIAVLSLNILGDSLRDHLDPRLRGSR